MLYCVVVAPRDPIATHVCVEHQQLYKNLFETFLTRTMMRMMMIMMIMIYNCDDENEDDDDDNEDGDDGDDEEEKVERESYIFGAEEGDGARA